MDEKEIKIKKIGEVSIKETRDAVKFSNELRGIGRHFLVGFIGGQYKFVLGDFCVQNPVCGKINTLTCV